MPLPNKEESLAYLAKANAVVGAPMQLPDEFRLKRKRQRQNREPKFVNNRMPWDYQAEIELMRSLCQKDFWTFFCYGFGAAINPKGPKWIDPEVHEPMARWFQMHVEQWEKERADNTLLISKGLKPNPKQTKLAVLVHREIGKTTKFTRAGQAWLHLRDPEIATATGAENMMLSVKMLSAIQAVMDGSDEYALWPRLYGDWSGQARKWSGKEIVHGARKNTSRQDPSMIAFAVETSITGSHPDVYFYDDPISYERLTTDTNWLQSVNSQVSSLIPVLQSDGLMVWVGTRYDAEDHFGTAFKDEGIASVAGMQTDSLQPTPDGVWHVYFLAGRDAKGEPTTPKVWPESRLKSYQRKDPLRYAAQIMNDPTISEFNPVTREQCNQCWVEPDRVPWSNMRFALLCDTAFWDGGKLAGKDETVMCVVGYPGQGTGDIYACECHYSNAWRGEDLAKRLVAKVQQYRSQGRRVFAITDEVTMSGKKGAWQMVLRNYFHDANEPMPTFYEFSRHSAPKVQQTVGGPTGRLVAAANFIVDGHVKFVKGGPGLPGLIDQIVQIGQYMVNPRLKIDRADAFSDAFQPELYQGMRMVHKQNAPWDRGATPIHMDGLDQSMFEDEDIRQWRSQVPREPIS